MERLMTAIDRARARRRASTPSRAGAAALVSASLFTASLAAGVQPAVAESDPAFGLWLVESQRAIVEIAACDGAPDAACGKIVWLIEPLDAAGQPKRDDKNPEEAMRSRALCGLPMIGDFSRSAPGQWEDGFIYDAAEGDTYSAWMEVESPDVLRVRGYVGVSLLGKTQTWTRETSNRGGC